MMDNKMNNKIKTRRLAAYALAGSMMITAAPVTMPTVAMADEVVEENLVAASAVEFSGDYELSVTGKNDVKKAGIAYSEIAKKLKVVAASSNSTNYDYANKASKVAVYECTDYNHMNDSNYYTKLVWDSEGHTSASAKDKLQAGKSYKIVSTFEQTLDIKSDSEYGLVDLINDSDDSDDSFDIAGDKKSATCTSTIVTGMLKPTSGGVLAADKKWYDKNGNDITYKGVEKGLDGKWYLVDNGVVPGAGSGAEVEKNKNGLWVIDKTKQEVDFSYNGIVSNGSVTGVPIGKYYATNGKVDTNKNGLVYQDGVWYNVVKGKVSGTEKDKNVIKVSDGNWVRVNKNSGETTAPGITKYTGFAGNANGIWYIKNDKVDFSKKGIVTVGASDDVYDALDKVYVEGGKVQTGKNGLIFEDGEVYNLKNGKVEGAEFDEPILAKDTSTGIWYVIGVDGKIANNANGLYKNANGIWYVENGKVDFNYTAFVRVDEDNQCTLDPDADRYYVVKGKVQTQENGVILADGGVYGKYAYYVKKGKLTDPGAKSSVIKASDGKWYSFDEQGCQRPNLIGANSNGVWYANASGVIDFKDTGFYTFEDDSRVGYEKGETVYIKDGKVQKDTTGIIVLKKDTITGNTNVKHYVKNGVVTDEIPVDEATVIKGTDGVWYYVNEDGAFDPGFNGVAKNKNGTWLVENGTVNFDRTVLFTDGDDTFYFVNSKLATDVTDVVKARATTDTTIDNSADFKTMYVEKGAVKGRETKDNVVKGSDGKWYYVNDAGLAGVTTSFDGLAQNKNGVWVIKKGMVDFDASGVIETGNVNVASEKIEDLGNVDVVVAGGKVQFSYTGLVVDEAGKGTYFEKGVVAENDTPEVMKGTDGKWYYVVDGKIKADYEGLGKNSNGVWYIYNGQVSFQKEGLVDTPEVSEAKLDAGKYYVSGGKYTTDKNGLVKSGKDQYYVVKGAVKTDIDMDESVIKIGSTWYYIDPAGKVAKPENNLAANKNGVWYVNDDGKVDFKYQGLATVPTDTTISALKNKDGKQIYLSGSAFDDEATLIFARKVNKEDANKTKTYIKNGYVMADGDVTSNTVVKGSDGSWYATIAGYAEYQTISATVAKNSDGNICYVDTNGEVKYNYNGLFAATIDYTALNVTSTDWVYFSGGVFAKETSGFVKVGTGNDARQVFVKRGIVTEPSSGDDVVRTEDGTLCLVKTDATVAGGTKKCVFDNRTTIAKYGSDYVYVQSGKVNKSYTKSNVAFDGHNINVKNGIVEGAVIQYKIDSFTATHGTAKDVDVTLPADYNGAVSLSGETAAGKISYDSGAEQIKVASDTPVGTYKVTVSFATDPVTIGSANINYLSTTKEITIKVVNP